MRALALLAAFVVVAQPLYGQTVTDVRVPASVAAKYSNDAACSAVTKDFTGSLGDGSSDTLNIRIENDQNRLAASPARLDVAIPGLISDTLGKDQTSKVFQSGQIRQLPGKVLTITRNGELVCALAIPLSPGSGRVLSEVRRAYRIGIGASFDFLSGVSANDLYSDLTVFQPKVWNGRFGIDAGMYNGRTAVRRDTVANVVRNIVVVRAARDSMAVVSQLTSRRNHVTHDELGLFLAPSIRIADFLSVVMHSEVIKRNVVNEIGITVDSAVTRLELDTLPSFWPVPSPLLPLPGDTTVVRRSSEYETFFGVGPLLNIEHGDLSFRAKPVIGTGVVNGHWQWLYLVQFRLTDFGNGFKIGGDIRGPLNLNQPTMLVYLARDYSFQRLANFLVGSDREPPDQ